MQSLTARTSSFSAFRLLLVAVATRPFDLVRAWFEQTCTLNLEIRTQLTTCCFEVDAGDLMTVK